ncbi:MAG: hypothetical protein QOI48_2825 [Solirubrobacteraceae bacterium]|nr:hypothetical protein [Solirubrobacteraceae bacterium]
MPEVRDHPALRTPPRTQRAADGRTRLAYAGCVLRVIVATPGNTVDMMLDDVGAEPNVRVLAGDVAVTAPGLLCNLAAAHATAPRLYLSATDIVPLGHRRPAARDRAGGRRCRPPAVDAPAGPDRRADRATAVPEGSRPSMLLCPCCVGRVAAPGWRRAVQDEALGGRPSARHRGARRPSAATRGRRPSPTATALARVSLGSVLLERQRFMDNQARAHAGVCLRRTRTWCGRGSDQSPRKKLRMPAPAQLGQMCPPVCSHHTTRLSVPG